MEEKLLEEKILKSFRKYEGKEVEDLELAVALDDGWDDEHTCSVMEAKNNGRVWFVECTKSGNVKETYEL